MQLIGNAITLFFVMLVVPRAASFLTSSGKGRRSPSSPCPVLKTPLSMFRKPFDSFVNLLDKPEKDNADGNTENQKSSKSGSILYSDASSSSKDLPSTETAKRVLQLESTTPSTGTSSVPTPNMASSTNNKNNKFDFTQRIESVKCAVIGAVSASLSVAPIALIHHVTTSLPQWELTTDMAALQGALFAIVYRYAIRNDDNPMLNQGVLGAFVLVRTLPTIEASPECTALPLQCT